MKLLIVAATKPEILPVYKHFNLPENDFVQTKDFDILITGAGMVATAFALGKHLNTSYSLVLNLGIAGCFDRNLTLGSLVNIVSDTFAELGAEDKDNFISIKELGFGESTYYNQNNLTIALPAVQGITVNKVTGSEESINRITNHLAPVTESMEGAAVFYACGKLNIPSLQIRSLSNYVEPRNKENWKIGLAIGNLNTWTLEFISTYTVQNT